MLYKLLSELSDRDDVDPRVISLLEPGPMAGRIRDLGVRVDGLGMPRGRLTLEGVRKLYRILRSEQPDVVQTWMYHADLVGGIVARLAGCRNVIWNIRSSTLEPDRDKRTTIWVARASAWLSSYVPQKIVTCAHEAGRIHANLGYDASKMTVIPNGFDTERLAPDEQVRRSVRDELDVQDKVVIGLVARHHPQKDHRTFVRAAKQIHARASNVHFVLCGDNVTWENQELVTLIREAGVEANVSLLGRRSDIPDLMNGLDLLVLSSASGEAFPNVLGEAMACGTPCVATRVGDSEAIIGDTGMTVPTRDEESLASACVEMLTLPEDQKHVLSRRARERVVEKYSLHAVSGHYVNVYYETSD